MPITYMEYLNALEKLDYKISSKDELITLVNGTVSVGTTMLVSEKGEPVKPETILVSMYTHNFFSTERTLAEIKDALSKQQYHFPNSTLWKALKALCKRKMIQKIKRGIYIQRTPPEKYFNKEIVD